MLNFEEFLFALRGKPNEERQSAIDYVFSIFDNGSGVADVNQMKQVFNCQKHPKFTMGKLNEDQMFYLYLKNFNNVVQPTVTKKVYYYFFKIFFRNGMIIMQDYLLLLIMMLILLL
jgi:hypothetical protein